MDTVLAHKNVLILLLVLVLFAATGVPAANVPVTDVSTEKPIPRLDEFLQFTESFLKSTDSETNNPIAALMQHEFSRQSAALRLSEMVQSGVEPSEVKRRNEAILSEIKRVWPLVTSRDVSEIAIPDLITAYALAIMSRQETELLERLAYCLMAAKRPPDEIVNTLVLLRKRSEQLMMMYDYLPSFDYETLELALTSFLAGHKLVSEKQALKECSAVYNKRPFNREVLYAVSCVLAQIGRKKKARDMLARCALLDSLLATKIMHDPDLADFRNDSAFMESLKTGTLRPEVSASQQFIIRKVELIYQWSGMGTPVAEERTLVWKTDRFVDQSSGQEIPGSLIQALLRHIKGATPVNDVIYHLTHTDDYPALLIRLSGPNTKPVLFYSESNTAGMLPFMVTRGGPPRAIHAESMGSIVNMLLAWLAVERGQPSGSYHFGGSEIPCDGLEGGGSQSSLAGRFRKAAGLGDAPAAPEKTAPAPAGLDTLAGYEITGQRKTVVPAQSPLSPLYIDYYSLQEKEGQKSCFWLIRFTRDDRSWWFGETPERMASMVPAARESASVLLGREADEFILRPMTKYGFTGSGYPSAADILKSLNMLLYAGGDTDWMGGLPVSLAVFGNTANGDMEFKGYYFPGKPALIVDDMEIKKPSPDHLLVKRLLAWCGQDTSITGLLAEMLLRNNKVYLIFKPDVAETLIAEIEKKASDTGRKPERAEAGGSQRILIETDRYPPVLMVSGKDKLELLSGKFEEDR